MEFIFIATAHFLALLSPGPDFFLIMQAALRLPPRYGIAICVGIAVANGTYLLVAVLGLQVIKDIPWLMLSLNYLGAAYLLCIGVLLLQTPRRSVSNRSSTYFLGVQHIGRQFMIGFMSGILNPKNMIFYLSLFTVMVSEQTPLITRFFYAAWMVSIVFIWDSAVVLTIGRDRVKNWLGRGVFYVEKLSGAVLTIFGLTLFFA